VLRKGSDGVPSTERKISLEEGGDVYLASTSIHLDHDVSLIDSGVSFHMTPHREWFCEYEKYNGGDVFLRDDSTAKITTRGRVKLLLKDRRIRTLLGVFHILEMARNLIFVSKMSDTGVHIVFEKETCKMFRGKMVLMMGLWNGNLYKLLGSTITDGCNIFVVFEGGNEKDRIPTVSREKTMVWHKKLGHIGEKGFQALYGKGMVEGMSNCTLDFDFGEHCIYGKKSWVRFSFGATRGKGILELIHSEVFGPVFVPS
jgi:hypothetical protein